MQKVNVILVDDIDGSDADETVTFMLDGTSYELDLNKKNADDFRGLFQDHIAVARKVSGGRKSSGKRSQSSSGSNAKDIREWAQNQGIDVPARGRIPESIREQYEASTKS